MENKLPKNWIIVPLEKLGEDKYYAIGDGDHGQIKPSNYQDYGIPYIRVGNLDWGFFKKEKLVYISEEVHNKNLKSELLPGDILIAKTGATIGKCCIVPNYITRANTTSSVGKVSINRDLTSNKWILYYFLSPDFFKLMWSHSHRTAQPGFNIVDLKKFPVPVPPLAEQNRIVAKLDMLFAQLEIIKASMEKIPVLLKDFRQQVLTQAISGELTEEWRKGKKIEKIKSEDIEKEREKLKKIKALNDGKKSFTYKKSSIPVLGVTTKGINKLFELPTNWDWVSLDQITWNISDGPHFSPKYTDHVNGKRFISMRNVTPQKINFEDCKYVSIEDHNEFIKRGKPQKGDLLYTKGGSTGIPCLIDDDVDFSYWVHVALLKTIPKFIDSKYLKNTLLSSFCYNQSQAFTHGVGNQDLGLTRMINITFPLPPLKEQQEIVRIIESLFLKADAIEKQYENLKQKIDILPQTILHKAFKGDLTEQLNSDGDARDLLKKIQEIKGQLASVSKKKLTKQVINKKTKYSL